MRSSGRLLAISVTLACALGGCGDGPPAAPPPALDEPATSEPGAGVNFDEVIEPVRPGSPHVRFIRIPGCVQCDKIADVLTAHRAKHPELKGDQFHSITKAGRRYLKENQLGNHGVVVYDRTGAVAWKNQGHTLDEPGLAGAVARVTAR